MIGIGETGLDYYYDKSDRRFSKRCFGCISQCARDRLTGDHPHPRCGGRHARHSRRRAGEGRFPGADPLLHRLGSISDAKVLALGLSISISGIVTFKNARDSAGRCCTRPFRATGCWSRRTARSSSPVPHRGRPCEPGVRPRYGRPSSRSFAAKSRSASTGAERTTQQFSRACSRRTASVKLLMLGSGTSSGVPRDRQRLGCECDPGEPRNRRTRVSILVESDAGQASACSSILRPTCASSCSTNERRPRSTRWCGRMTTPTIATGSMICGAMRYGREAMPLPGYADRRNTVRGTCGERFELCLRRPARLSDSDRAVGACATGSRLVAGFWHRMGCEMPHGPAHKHRVPASSADGGSHWSMRRIFQRNHACRWLCCFAGVDRARERIACAARRSSDACQPGPAALELAVRKPRRQVHGV